MFLYTNNALFLLNHFDINNVERTAVFENNYSASLYFLLGGV